MASSINASTTAGVVTTADTSGVLNIQTAGTTAITVDASQNVGLGVTPSAWTRKAIQLGDAAAAYVANNSGGATVIATNMYFDGSNKYATTAAAARYSVGTGTHEWYTAASGTAGNAITFTQAMTLNASGNLGIGTSSPTNPLHIVSNTVSQLNVAASSGNTNAQINLEPTGTGIALIGPANSVAFAFRTNATEAMRIDSSGNLLVGTSSLGTTFGATSGVIKETGGVWTDRGQFSAGASSTTTFVTLANASNNQSYIVSVRQSGSGSNFVSAFTIAYGATSTSIRFAQDNTNPALDMNITSSGLAVRLVLGSGYGTTTWDWVITRLG